jgi:hypothetical protein
MKESPDINIPGYPPMSLQSAQVLCKWYSRQMGSVDFGDFPPLYHEWYVIIRAIDYFIHPEGVPCPPTE